MGDNKKILTFIFNYGPLLVPPKFVLVVNVYILLTLDTRCLGVKALQLSRLDCAKHNSGNILIQLCYSDSHWEWTDDSVDSLFNLFQKLFRCCRIVLQWKTAHCVHQIVFIHPFWKVVGVIICSFFRVTCHLFLLFLLGASSCSHYHNTGYTQLLLNATATKSLVWYWQYGDKMAPLLLFSIFSWVASRVESVWGYIRRQRLTDLTWWHCMVESEATLWFHPLHIQQCLH